MARTRIMATMGRTTVGISERNPLSLKDLGARRARKWLEMNVLQVGTRSAYSHKIKMKKNKNTL
jgi:hypothetical protein